MKRVVTAAILTPLIIATILAAPPWLFTAVVALIALLCFFEFCGIVEHHGIRPPGVFGYVAGLLLLLAPKVDADIVVAFAVIALALSLRWRDLSECLPWASAVILGVAYVFGCWRFAIELHGISHRWLLFAVSLNWVGDIAAYYVGRSFGRHRLAPAASPNKSWEGSIASVLASVGYAALYFRWLYPQSGVPYVVALGIAAAANCAGQFGDIAESALKRGAGLKDSGNLLPGHGGWLDRVDSSLFAMPTVYLLVAWYLGKV
jgi:phosphatidate cytidylyltransferase